METMNGSSGSGTSRITEDLQGELARLDAERHRLNGELDGVSREMQRISRALSVLTDENFGRTVKRIDRRTRRKKAPSVSQERQDKMMAHLIAKGQGAVFTIPQVAGELGWNQATTNVTVQSLRDSGRLRFSGKDRNTFQYKVFDGEFAAAEA